MTPTSFDTCCPHCDAELPARELSDGWCDNCGKRLPTSQAMQPKKVDLPAVISQTRPGQASMWLLGAVAFAALGGIATLFFVVTAG